MLLTPGWVCTSAMAFVFHYILELDAYDPGGSFNLAANDATNALHEHGDAARTDDALQTVHDALAAPGVDADLVQASYTDHEFCAAQLFPHAKLMEEAEKPFAGRLAAYHPFSGDAFEATDTGRLYWFESAGSMKRARSGLRIRTSADADPTEVRGQATTFGCSPFRFEAVEDDSLAPVIAGAELHMRGGDRRVAGHFRVRNAQLRARHVAAGPRPPIVICNGSGAPLGPRARAPGSSHPEDLYAERAIPSPTMDELRGRGAQTFAQGLERSATARARATMSLDDNEGDDRDELRAYIASLPG
jgi:hypothetical protein